MSGEIKRKIIRYMEKSTPFSIESISDSDVKIKKLGLLKKIRGKYNHQSKVDLCNYIITELGKTSPSEIELNLRMAELFRDRYLLGNKKLSEEVNKALQAEEIIDSCLLAGELSRKTGISYKEIITLTQGSGPLRRAFSHIMENVGETKTDAVKAILEVMLNIEKGEREDILGMFSVLLTYKGMSEDYVVAVFNVLSILREKERFPISNYLKKIVDLDFFSGADMKKIFKQIARIPEDDRLEFSDDICGILDLIEGDSPEHRHLNTMAIFQLLREIDSEKIGAACKKVRDQLQSTQRQVNIIDLVEFFTA